MSNFTHHRAQFVELELHRLCADASELGLQPGEWPAMVHFAEHVGNGQAFVPSHVDSQGARTYRQVMGCLSVTIFND